MDPSHPSELSIAGKGIKSWPQDDRPREKLLLKGVQALSNAELIAILLRTGDKSRTALALAQELLQTVEGDLLSLSRLSVKDCTKIKGIGKVKAVTLVASLELGRRRQSGDLFKKPVIKKSSDAAQILQPLLADFNHEVFVVLFLNTANQVLHSETISRGGMKGTVVDPKMVLRKAIEQEAANLILCHNHPSGDLKPSKADISLTGKICDAARLLDIIVLDHLIVSSHGFFSFADERLM